MVLKSKLKRKIPQSQRKIKKNQLKRKLNTPKKKNKKMMDGLLFLLQEKIQREDDSYRYFFEEAHSHI